VNVPELLAPAGSPEALDAAIGEGADAVYLGLKSFNARLRSANFAFSQFEAAVAALHRLGKRLYLTVNTVFEEREADRMWQFLEYVERVGPDAIIVQDLGVARMARAHFPSLRLHASTQMNVGSARGVNQLSRLGFKRVVLPRELSIEEIAAIKAGSSLELEAFVHGALCVSCSGLCLFSSFLGGKSANRGACAQACRRLYVAGDSEGYWFSPDDLELVAQLPALTEAGLSSLKIEGRMKSAEYVGTVVSAYRRMLDGMGSDPERALAEARAILANDFARAKTMYFALGPGTRFIRPAQAGGTGISLGRVRETREVGGCRYCLIEGLASGGSQTEGEGGGQPGFAGIAPGDSLRLHGARDGERRTTRVLELNQGLEGLWLRLADPASPGDSVYVIQPKAMSRRYKPVLPPNLDSFRRQPGRARAPSPAGPPPGRADKDVFPEGLYAMTDRVADLFTFQSMPPAKAMLRISRESLAELLDAGRRLPFRGDSLVAVLDPFFPEADAAWLDEAVEALMGAGVRRFVANNLGHFGLLRKRDLALASGEYLYAFNAWAVAHLREMGAALLTAPLEISKQDLLRTLEPAERPGVFVSLFAAPALFRMRARLLSMHGYEEYVSKEGEAYVLREGAGGSVLIPAQPFSIVDRRAFLMEAGFRRFILDFSYMGVKKADYRDIMGAALSSSVLPGTTRFNWKDGFWSPDEDRPRDGAPRDGVFRKPTRGRPEGPGEGRGSAGPRRDRGPRGAGSGGGRGPSRS